MKGQIVLPSDPSYDEVREIWNAMIDRRPALIVRCAEANDVVHAISFARENGLEISIRGGGHNIAGNALCDDGVMIDLSTMRNVFAWMPRRSAPMLNLARHWPILMRRLQTTRAGHAGRN